MRTPLADPEIVRAIAPYGLEAVVLAVIERLNSRAQSKANRTALRLAFDCAWGWLEDERKDQEAG